MDLEVGAHLGLDSDRSDSIREAAHAGTVGLAYGPARNCLNVPGSFRAARNFKSPKFIFWPEIQFLTRNSVFAQNSH
jgi:hypothetical protein